MRCVVLALLGFIGVFAPSSATLAMSLLELEGKYRVVNIYNNTEIPAYLRSSSCRSYAYEQKFEDHAFIRGADTRYPVPAGSLESDLQAFRARNICLLRLRGESMIRGTRRPVTLYEIDMLGAGPNELRAGENHRPMRDGTYDLENGDRITVKDSRVSR